MLKVGDKIEIIDYGLFSIRDNEKKETYTIDEILDDGRNLIKVGPEEKPYSQVFGNWAIGVYVKKVD